MLLLVAAVLLYLQHVHVVAVEQVHVLTPRGPIRFRGRDLDVKRAMRNTLAGEEITVTRGEVDGVWRGVAIPGPGVGGGRRLEVVEVSSSLAGGGGGEENVSLPFDCNTTYEPPLPEVLEGSRRLSAELQPGPDGMYAFTPGCYPGDEARRRLTIGVALDSGVSDNDAELALSNTKLLYLRQFNIILDVDDGIVSWDNPPPCTRDYSQRLSQFGEWSLSQTSKGLWHLVTNCWPPPGTVGIAGLGTLCVDGSNVGITSLSGTSTWVIMAHEMGHTLGATHSFENGMGHTGGVMDYGNIYYNGVIQFHPLKRDNICPLLTARAGCAHFTPEGSPGGECGNMLLEEGEECECLDSSPSCRGCNECKLSDSDAKCSTKEFVIRRSGVVEAISKEMLSSSECCIDGKIMDGTRTCGYGGACYNGKCMRLCSRYGLSSCPVTEGGCRQPCGPECIDSLQTQISKVFISYLPDNAPCANGKGVCRDGLCSVSASNSIPCPMVNIKQCPKQSKIDCLYKSPWRYRCYYCNGKCRARSPRKCRDRDDYYDQCLK